MTMGPTNEVGWEMFGLGKALEIKNIYIIINVSDGSRNTWW